MESKIHPNCINKQQLEGHWKYISGSNSFSFLLYITPDEEMPDRLKDHYHVYWRNWRSLVESLKIYVDNNPDRLMKYLVDEFEKTVDIVVFKQRMQVNVEDQKPLLQEGKEERVIIVGGRWGEDVALKYNIYACQPNRYW